MKKAMWTNLKKMINWEIESFKWIINSIKDRFKELRYQK